MENKEADSQQETEYLKVTKNTKGYNWEIKLIAIPNIDIVERMKQVNQKMVEQFGTPVSGSAYIEEGEVKKK